MGRIIIFSEFYYPRLISSGYFITEIAEYLARRLDVTIICLSEGTQCSMDAYNGVNIIRIPDVKLNKNNLIQRTYKFYRNTQSFYKIGTKIINPEDQVICLTNPAFSIVGIAKLKKKIGFSFTILVHDVFPENLIGSKIFPFKGLVYYLLFNIFKNAYKKSDKIIVIGRDMKEIFTKKLNNFKGDIIQIPNWGDSKKIYPAMNIGKNILNNMKVEDAITFQFSGNIGRAQGIYKIIKAAELLKNFNINFLFFGNGALKEYVRNKARKNNKIIYGGMYSRENANAYLNACDISIVSLLPGMRGLGVPSKTYDIMAAGKPILYIGPANSEVAFLISEEKIGWIVTTGEVRDIVATIKHICQFEIESIEMLGKNARNVLVNKYSKEAILLKYSTVWN